MMWQRQQTQEGGTWCCLMSTRQLWVDCILSRENLEGTVFYSKAVIRTIPNSTVTGSRLSGSTPAIPYTA